MLAHLQFVNDQTYERKKISTRHLANWEAGKCHIYVTFTLCSCRHRNNVVVLLNVNYFQIKIQQLGLLGTWTSSVVFYSITLTTYTINSNSHRLIICSLVSQNFPPPRPSLTHLIHHCEWMVI